MTDLYFKICCNKLIIFYLVLINSFLNSANRELEKPLHWLILLAHHILLVLPYCLLQTSLDHLILLLSLSTLCSPFLKAALTLYELSWKEKNYSHITLLWIAFFSSKIQQMNFHSIILKAYLFLFLYWCVLRIVLACAWLNSWSIGSNVYQTAKAHLLPLVTASTPW